MKRKMAALWRSNCVGLLAAGCLIFLVYTISVAPSIDMNNTHYNDQERADVLSGEAPLQPVDSLSKNIPGESVKLRSNFLANFQMKKLDDVADIIKPETELDNHKPDKPERVMGLTEMQDDYLRFINYVNDDDIQHPLLNKHQYKFLLNNKYACFGEVFLLVLIHSAAQKQQERNEIRNTWGAIRTYSGANIVTLFLLAKSLNKNITAAIEKESRTYNDIVLGDFIDHYRNLTYKNVMGLHWTMTYCNHTKFVLKTDDDTMVDMYHLISFLFQKSPDGEIENFLYCSTYYNIGPVRRPGDKWFVTKHEYPYSKYPPYCEGFAYVMSIDVVGKLYTASKSVPFYWVDDVYATGFLAAKAGVTHRDMEHGHAYNLMQSEHLSRNVQSCIFLLAKYSYLRKNWDRAWRDILTLNAVAVES